MARSSNLVVNITGDARDLLRAFGQAEKASQTFGKKVQNDLSILGGWAKKGALAIAAIGTAVAGIAIKGGIDRLMGLERASKKLEQMGVSGRDADLLMKGLLKTVEGTPFALDAGAASMAGFVASGRDLKDIPRLLQQVTDAAAFGNTTLDEMDIIWRRIQTTGRASNRELLLLAQRQIPVYEQLAAGLGVTGAEVRQLATDGKISADIFFDAWERAADGTIDGAVRIAGAAKAMGDTTEGAWANMRTAMSRFGATLLDNGGLFDRAKDAFNAIGEGFDRMGEVFKSAFADSNFDGLDNFISKIPDMMEAAAEGVVTLWRETEGLRKVLQTTFVGALAIVENRLVQLGAIGLGVYKLLTLTASHPLLTGLALLALAIGATEMRAREAEAAGKDLASRWEEMTVLARELALIELFPADQIAVLESAGVTLRDLADETISYDEALALVNDEITNFLGLTAPMDMAGKGTIETLKGLVSGTEAYEEATKRSLEAQKLEYDEQVRANFHRDRIRSAIAEVTSAQADLEDETRSTTDALKEQQEELRAMTDPVFNLERAIRNLEEAQLAYDQAVDEHGPTSDEAMENARNLASAYHDVESAYGDVEAAAPGLEQSFRNLAKEMGIADETINAFIGSTSRVPKTITTRVDVTVGKIPNIHTIPGGGVRVSHQGEHRVPGVRGSEQLRVVQAGERILSATEADRYDKGLGGAQTIINLSVNALDPQAAARAVVEALQAWQARNGPIPVVTR